jgi:lysophospholipase L1-like esterase
MRIGVPSVAGRRGAALPGLAAVLALLVAGCGRAPVRAGDHWVGTWATSPVASPATEALGGSPPGLDLRHRTLRQIVRVTLGGERVRIRLSNQYAREPLVIGSARLALRDAGPAIVAGSDRALTFGGLPSIRIPPGAVALSDQVRLDVPSAADLAVSLHVAGAGEVTWHPSAFQTSYVTAPGDHTAAVSLPEPATISSWFFLTGVMVAAARDATAVVALGDSITDGASSTTDTNGRWPDVLATRLTAAKRAVGVLNAGIGGNRILHDGGAGVRVQFGESALARFDRDVIAQAGVRYVVVLLGINDIGHPGTPGVPSSEDAGAAEIVSGLRQLIARAHTHGLRIFGATLTPFEETAFLGYYTPAKEQARQAVNAWIREGGEFDGVIDFDRAVRDPERPGRLLPRYNSGDNLHPSDAGLRAMGDAIDLALFDGR